MVAAFSTKDLANGFPICDVYVNPRISLFFWDSGLRRFDILGNVGLDIENVGIFVEALEERGISYWGNGGEEVPKYSPIACVMGVVEDTEDGVHIEHIPE